MRAADSYYCKGIARSRCAQSLTDLCILRSLRLQSAFLHAPAAQSARNCHAIFLLLLLFPPRSLVHKAASRQLLHLHCGYPLSRYTCRATRVAADFLDSIAFCRCSTGVALHPLKILVSHLPPPPVPGGVAPKFGCLKRCRATRGCRRYSCGCRATLCN